MSPTLANFLFEAANFLVLAGALGWFAFKPIRTALRKEMEAHASEDAKITQVRAEASLRQEEAKDATAKLEAELSAVRLRMLGEAEAEAGQVRERARQQQQAQVRASEQAAEAARREALDGLVESVGMVAAKSVRRLLESLSGPSLDRALVRAASERLAALPADALGGCVVEHARPLDAEQRKLIGDVVGEDFAERSIPELGAGVRVTTRAGQVDASALAIAREAARAVAVAVGPPGERTGA